MAKDMTLTSVKIQSELFEDFKVECVRKKLITILVLTTQQINKI